MSLFDDALDAGQRLIDTFRADSFGNSSTGLGIPNVDTSLGARPQYLSPLSFEERRQIMRSSGLLRRCVELIPDLATVRGWRVVLDDDEMDPAIARDACADSDETYDLIAKVRAADRLARMDGDAFVFVVTDDADPNDPDPFAAPLDLEKVTQIEAVHVLDAEECRHLAADPDPRSEAYRDTAIWQISLATEVISSKMLGGLGATFRVHRSRIIRIPGVPVSLRERIDNDHRNGSMLELYRTPVADVESLNRSAAIIGSRWELLSYRMAGLGVRRATKQGSDAASLSKRIRAMAQAVSTLGVLVMGSEDELQRLGASGSGYDEVHQTARRSVSSVEGISQRELFGDQPGGLGTNDENAAQMRDRVARAHQTLIIRPALVKLYAITLAAKGYRGSFEVVFEPLNSPTESEQAATDLQRAQTDQTYISTGVLDAEEVRRSRFGSADSAVQLDERDGDEDELDLDLVEALRDDAESFTPPAAVRAAARRSLQVRSEKPPSQRGMTPTGLARARDLANGRPVSLQTIRRMSSYFARHEVDKSGSTWKTKGKGWQAWNGWGGDPGRTWVEGILAKIEREDADAPAPPRDRIKGSKSNPEGSASGSRGGIAISEATEEALRRKVEEHNEKHGSAESKRVDLGKLKAVFRRGAGAFSVSHRPGMTRNQWALARVNSFLYLVRNGRPENAKYTSDNDLLPKGHPKRPKE